MGISVPKLVSIRAKSCRSEQKNKLFQKLQRRKTLNFRFHAGYNLSLDCLVGIQKKQQDLILVF